MECNLGWNHTCDLKSQVWFQTKIARHEVQLPLYYIHFEIAQIQDLVSSNILLMQYWAGLKLNSSIFLEGKSKSFGNKSCKICHMILFVFHFSCNLIGFFKQALKSASSLAGEKIRFKAKMVRFVNKSHQLELVRLQGPPVISKWV